MKRLFILMSIAAASLANVRGAIPVGTTGSGLIDFTLRPAPTEWSTASSPGTDATISTPPELDAVVQGVMAAAINAQVVDGAGANPPAQNALAVWTAAAGGPSYLQTRPTGNAGTVLMATLRNDTGTDATSMTIAYLLSQSAANPTEQVPGHQVHVSLTGEPNSWMPIPSLSGGPAGFRSNVVVLPSAWVANSLLYVLWADDNAMGGTDRGYQLDNVMFTASNADVPLSVTLTAPAGNQLLVAPADVQVAAMANGTVPAESVSFYTNGVLFSTHTALPYSNQLVNLPPGNYAIHAVALNAAETAYSRTNLVRVRDEFIHYFGGTHLENFNGMGAANGETPMGWYVGAGLPATTMTVTGGDGSAGAAGAILGWNYGTTGQVDRALGTAPTGADRNIVARIQNNSASNIVSFDLRYDGEVWRNYTNAVGGVLTNHVSFDLGNSWIPTTFDFTQPFPPAEPQAAIDGNSPNSRTPDIGGTVTPPAPVPPGSVIYLRWHDANDPNVTDGGLAIDNVRFTAAFARFTSFINITSPSNGATFAEAASVVINVTAAMENAITHVSFFQDGVHIGDDTNAPFSLIYSNAIPGTHALSATAYDVQGLSVTVAMPTEITVNSNVLPTVSGQPQSQLATLGSTVNLTVDVSGTPPFSYQWHLNCRNILDGTNQALTIQGVGLEDIGNYSVTVRNALGQVTTWDAALAVTNVPAPQVRLGREKNNLVLRWPRRDVPYRLQALTKFENVGPTETQRWGDSDLSLELIGLELLADVAPEDNNMFFRVSSPSVQILRQPQGKTVALGEQVTLSVLATGTPPLSYQWRFNGSPLLGETNSTISLDVNRFSYGAYQVAVEDANDALLSSAAVLRPNGAQTVLSDSFSGRALFSDADGSIHGLTLGATREAAEPEHAGLPGGRSVWLSWRAPFSGVATFDTMGSGFDTLLAAYGPNVNVIAADDDSASNLCSRIRFNVTANTIYDVALDGLAGAGGFFVLNWSVLQTPAGVALPVITVQPGDRIIASNEVTTFTVSATDLPGANLTYQWFQNGVPVPETQGGTSPTLRVGGQPPSAPSAAGQFHVEVSNSAFTVRSRYASLQFSTDPQLRFVSKLLIDSICGFAPYDPSKSLSKCCGAPVGDHGDHPKTTTTKLLSASAGSLTGSLTYGGTVPPVGSRAYWTWITNGWDCLKLVSLAATVQVGSTPQSCTLVLIDSTTGLLVKAADKGLSPNLSNINKAKAGKIYWIALGFDNPSAVGTLTYSFSGTCP